MPDLHQLLQQRDDVLRRGDLLLVNQDVGILDDGFHLIGVGDEIGREIAAVELHAFDELGLVRHGLGLFDGDHAVFADLVHHVRDQFADLLHPRRSWSPRERSLPVCRS